MAKSKKNWISKAFDPKNKGLLHKSLHIPMDEKIPVAELQKAAKSKNKKLAKRAQLVLNIDHDIARGVKGKR